MKLPKWVAVLSLSIMAFGVEAHAHLKSSSPKEGEVLMQVPTSIALTFSESARITALSLQKDQEAKQSMVAPTTVGEQIKVSVPTLSAGAYTLSWRVMSTDDNHIMSGELHFKVAPMNMDMSKTP
jgi:methionine-rich copper-binding protein CopC